MKLTLAVAVSAGMLAGCASMPAPNPQLVGDQPLIIRSAILASCPSQFGQLPFDKTEGVLSGSTGEGLAVKAAGAVVTALSRALNKAAEADRASFAISGNSTEYLYTVRDEDAPEIRRCLVVAAGVRQVAADDSAACGSDRAWLSVAGSTRCSPAISDKLAAWQMTTPVFYSELMLHRASDAPLGYLRGLMLRVYYPQPLSDLGSKKIKNTSLVIEASNPANGIDTGKALFSATFLNSWLKPGINHQHGSVADSEQPRVPDLGRWLSIPTNLESLGQAGGPGGAVDVTVTLTETQTPTKWLQKLNDYVQQERDNLKSSVESRTLLAVSAGARQQVRDADAASQLEQQADYNDRCIAYSLALQEFSASAAVFEANNQSNDSRFAMRRSCNMAKQARLSADQASRTGGSGDATLCALGAADLPQKYCGF